MRLFGKDDDNDPEEITADIVKSDSQLIVNSINDEISVPKDIINLVIDIRVVSSYCKDIRI